MNDYKPTGDMFKIEDSRPEVILLLRPDGTIECPNPEKLEEMMNGGNPMDSMTLMAITLYRHQQRIEELEKEAQYLNAKCWSS